ncbi:MAG: SIS domain-containing protein [Anaerolineae bacterium]|nr:SIS domain-containing protein [Anaerolineae bacterium]
MAERGEYTLSEILSQPDVWATVPGVFRAQTGALDALWKAHTFEQVLFTGCGSTHYLSMTGAALFQTLTGIPAVARPASEIVLFPDLVFAPGAETLLVTVSRSGATTETVEAVKVFRAHGGKPVVAITCDADTPLGRQADIGLAVPAAQEQSVAQTRSFSSMAVLSQALAAHLSGQDVMGALDKLPGILRRLLDAYRDTAEAIGEDTGLDRFFFLGGGALYGIACEAMLKMKEMSLSYSEAYHPLEFRHGPMSMVNERSLVVGLLSESARTQEIAVLRDMHGHGAQILAVTETGDDALAGWTRAVVELQSGLPGWARPALYLPLLQLMAYRRAMMNGQNPDRPAKLGAVVSLDAAALHN